MIPLLALGAIAILVAYRYQVSRQQWKSFVSLMIFASFLVVARISLQVIFGAPFGSDIIFRLPSLDLPAWLTGVRIGGAVTLQSFQSALMQGLGLAVTIAFIAAASTVTSIPKLLRQLPASFQSFATLIIIAVTFIPTVFDDVQRLRKAHRWRGFSGSWLQRLRYNIIALGDGALRRSVILTSSMVTRGYRLESANAKFLLLALSSSAIGFGVWTSIPTAMNLVYLLLFVAGIFFVLHFRNSRDNALRTKFHDDAWSLRDYLLIGSAAIAALLLTVSPLISVALGLLPLAPALQRRVAA